MSSIFDQVHFSGRTVLGLGVTLVAVGVLLPVGFLLWVAIAKYHAALQPQPVGALIQFRPELVILPPGSFQTGGKSRSPAQNDDETPRLVKIERQFALSRTEITQKQYFEVTGKDPVNSRLDANGEDCAAAGIGDDLPVVCVDWLDAVTFCNALSSKEGLAPAYTIDGSGAALSEESLGYRLPTEAEWEYAALAGTRQLWAGTDKPSEVCDFGNVADDAAMAIIMVGAAFACNDGFAKLAPVGSFSPNGWQIFDLTGNVWEWVWDSEDEGVSHWVGRARVAAGRNSPSSRILRGGSWRFDDGNALLATRALANRSHRDVDLGFRIARSIRSEP